MIGLLWIVVLWKGVPIDPVDTALPAGAGADPRVFSWHSFLIDSTNPMWPLTMQSLMWVGFFVCMGELLIRWFCANRQKQYAREFDIRSNRRLELADGQFVELSANEVLKPEFLAAIYRSKADAGVMQPDSMIAAFFETINYQFQSSNDVGDVYSSVSSKIDLELHAVDLNYTAVRYIAWLIPTLGFVGTVIGIVQALGNASVYSQSEQLLIKVVPYLGTAFYTTLLALLLSAIIMFMAQVIQAAEERIVNDIGKYCLDSIVSQLKARS